jgi:hypothetical protein
MVIESHSSFYSCPWDVMVTMIGCKYCMDRWTCDVLRYLYGVEMIIESHSSFLLVSLGCDGHDDRL